MSRVTDMLTAPQTARANMRAGSGFEAEASMFSSPQNGPFRYLFFTNSARSTRPLIPS
jgi:hypothetical protein